MTVAAAGDDLVVRELERGEAVEDEGVEPLGVAGHLGLRAVAAVAEQLDDDRRAREPAVDAHEPVAGLGEHGLGLGPGQAGVGDEAEELALEPAVAAARDLAAVEDVEQRRDAEAALASAGRRCVGAARPRSSRPSRTRVDRRRQPSPGGSPRARSMIVRVGLVTGRPSTVSRSSGGSIADGVHDDAEAAHVALARHRDVERSAQREPVEAVQRGGGRAGRPARLADVERRAPEVGERRRSDPAKRKAWDRSGRGSRSGLGHEAGGR